MSPQREVVCFDCDPGKPCAEHSPTVRAKEYGRRANIQWASEIRPRKQVWLWENKIPIGTPSALAGRGGTGKTSYVLHLIARLSRGQLRGEYYGTPQRSLIWSGEDSWDKVLVPRLIAAGADLGMVGRLRLDTLVDDETLEVAPKLPLDTAPIAEAVTESGAVMALLDPIASTMSGDLHRESDVRIAVDALARVAEDTGAVMMFVRHFGKGGGNASDKMSGSHAFRDAVRSVFLFAEDGDRVIVSQDKGNYAPRGEESFAFRLESTTVDTDDGPTEVARVVELGTSEVSVGEIINRSFETDEDRDATSARRDVDDWLREVLKNGPLESNTVYDAADAAGFSKDKAKRAKARIKAEAYRETGDGPWLWRLPKGADAQESTVSTRDFAPLLPCTSEGVQSGDENQGSNSAEACSLGPATATVTVLNSRRSHDEPPPNAAAWLLEWIANNGNDDGWVKPSDAFTAGRSVGLNRDAIIKAKQVYADPPIESSGNGRGSMWRIVRDGTPEASGDQ
ncbi:hypothetical protein MMUR_05530 [Mycolicibacterium murale]|uniref:AAA family ATPase n=1 Tax=Mycolicibacterium murale TaxID=182220 RepID=A0A7I9WGK3_9MYCO|nr:AAA family ATPase [Mycolicibacterium murale]GFG56417.1 hypothetical protein MMUR_05530 [Mycolicibacterium murale]